MTKLTKTINLDRFLAEYVKAALWTSTNEEPQKRSGECLDACYDMDDIDGDSLEAMRLDCEKFIKDNEADLLTWEHPQYSVEVMGGHDFWLTRGGHGSGFWDGDWEDAVGKRLTAACEAYPTCYLYVGDDDQIHLA